MEGERGLKESVTVRVPARDVGKVIGKAGATIKELQGEHGVHISVPKDKDKDPIDVVVEGPPSGVKSCVEHLGKILGYAVRGEHGAAPAGATAAAAVLDSPPGSIKDALFFPDPSGAVLERFLYYLRGAQHSIAVAVYTLSDRRIADTLRAAHRRGVMVRIVSDNDTVRNTGSDVEDLAKDGIAVRLDGVPGPAGAPLRMTGGSMFARLVAQIHSASCPTFCF
jgi:hypothetical protein